MKLLKNIVLASVISCCCGNLYAGPASARLSALADSLIKDYQAKTAASNTTLAAFPFSCDEILSKQRVGFAVAELMSHRFVAEPGFTVVERGEINRLLAEQKLQASGATDSATAVKLGQMAGANVLLMGNISRVDGLYQVNARMVSVATGEVLVSGYAELPVEAFREDAGIYLNIVPEAQRIGVYVLYNWRHNANSLSDDTIVSDYNTATLTATVRPREFSAGLGGVGVRYSPTKKTTLDLSVMKGTPSKVAGAERLAVPGPSMAFSLHDYPEVAPEIRAVRFLLSLSKEYYRRFFCYAGAGVSYYQIQGEPKITYLTPSFQLRSEYFLQERVGFSFSLNYDLFDGTKRQNLPGIDESWGRFKYVRLSKISIEPSLSIYF